MIESMTLQGRILTGGDIEFISTLIKDNPDWNRTRLSVEICRAWDWYTPYGQQKDMACRTMLLKLERRGFIKLPPRMCPCTNSKRTGGATVPHQTNPVEGRLSDVTPLGIRIVREPHEQKLFSTYLNLYHYLGLRSVVGENIRYLVESRDNIPLACVLFGSAAWKAADRDQYLGWGQAEREQNLFLIANNHRYLIFPWVRVKFLASHILSLIVKRLSDDWLTKYRHPLVLAETFVECGRFTGTCYKAAGWKCVGETTGRGKDDTHHKRQIPKKYIMVYPLCRNFRSHLTGQAHG